MMKIAALCLLAVVVSAAPANDAPKTLEVASGKPTPTSNATEIRYVKHAHRASLNFACPVDSIVVTPNFDLVSPDVADAITQIELEDHLGEVDSIQWGHTLQNYFQGTDPRGQERELATLGGDLGEFLMVLGAIEAEQSVEFTPEDVEAKLKMYLTVMSKEKFFFSIDGPAIATFKKACGCPNLNIADPPDAKKELLLNATVDPASMGDEFFNKVIADAAGYGLRPELVQSVLSAFFNTMWNKADPLHRRIKFALLKGDYDPKGFIMVKTPGYCNAQLLAPMISPELCGKQMGIYHGDASVLLRTEMAGVLLIKSPESKNAVVRKANEMAAAAVVKLLEGHTEPVYTVTFQGKE
jgi:hypothetical protein